MSDNDRNALGKIIASCWSDDAYRARLNSDPSAVLAEEGIDVGGRQVAVHYDSWNTVNVVIPRRPADLTDEHISRVHTDITKLG